MLPLRQCVLRDSSASDLGAASNCPSIHRSLLQAPVVKRFVPGRIRGKGLEMVYRPFASAVQRRSQNCEQAESADDGYQYLQARWRLDCGEDLPAMFAVPCCQSTLTSQQVRHLRPYRGHTGHRLLHGLRPGRRRLFGAATSHRKHALSCPFVR